MQLDVLIEQKSLIHGDALSISIAAASIIAKVERDRQMIEWDLIYPQYGLAQHKGYATPEHLAALRCARTDAASSIFLRPGARSRLLGRRRDASSLAASSLETS